MRHLLKLELRPRWLVWTEKRPGAQAKRNAKWVADFLSKRIGQTVPTQAIVALPGWFVQDSGKEVVRLKEPVKGRDRCPQRSAGARTPFKFSKSIWRKLIADR